MSSDINEHDRGTPDHEEIVSCRFRSMRRTNPPVTRYALDDDDDDIQVIADDDVKAADQDPGSPSDAAPVVPGSQGPVCRFTDTARPAPTRASIPLQDSTIARDRCPTCCG